jgi:hypothetical protein
VPGQEAASAVMRLLCYRYRAMFSTHMPSLGAGRKMQTIYSWLRPNERRMRKSFVAGFFRREPLILNISARQIDVYESSSAINIRVF